MQPEPTSYIHPGLRKLEEVKKDMKHLRIYVRFYKNSWINTAIRS